LEQFLPTADRIAIEYAVIAVLLPLTAAVINRILPGKTNRLAGWVSVSAGLISTVFSAIVFVRVWNAHEVHLYIHWFAIGNAQIEAGILLNNLSVLMLLLVNVIALPVQLYSIAYMGHDDNPRRYFTCLSFFCFSMLALVVADNLLLFYIFWELVGFSSYLLIGFWFTREKAVAANKKAFIINRIGDIGLLTAIIVLYTQFHTFDLNALFGHGGTSLMPANAGNGSLRVGDVAIPVLYQHLAFAGIFLAVAAKSAQFPLHTWLPDAMEGPTAVSALIHAATMVAAGIFLLARVYPFFSPAELNVLAVSGCFTAFMAATIALVQNDIKRILAYSTISQLGYMVMAMGLGAYGASLFHLAAHAFFKCLLFLVAGIVIHQMELLKSAGDPATHTQNIQNMGGLRRRLPLTFVTAIVAAAALTGLPLTTGFLSKDTILVQAFSWAGGKGAVAWLIPGIAVLTGWLTAFYITRLVVKVFIGKPGASIQKKITEPGADDRNWLYRLPLVLLAACCLFPLFSANPFSAANSWLLTGLGVNPVNASANVDVFVPIVVSLGSIGAIIGAWLIYSGRLANPFPQTGLLFRFVCGQWYFDELYNLVIVKPVLLLSRACFWTDRRIIDNFIVFFAKLALLLSKIAVFTDRRIVDGFINLVVTVVRGIGDGVRRMQGGKVQYYLFSMLAAVLALFILKILF
jgi:NADH-quinone oxidoreductase subunit L